MTVTAPGPPLFIIGSGRSGNTLVRRVLLASGQIYIPAETYEIGPIISDWWRGRLLRWREKVRLFCAYFEKHRHFHTFGLPNLDGFAKEAANWPSEKRVLRALFEGFYAYLAEQEGRPPTRWGDKTPYNSYHLRPIARVFPDAQFVWLRRNGLDAAASYVEAGLSPDLADAAGRWTQANADCRKFARKHPNVGRARYESLVSEPERAFADLFALAGLDFRPEMLTADPGPMGDVERERHHAAVTRPISARSVGRWREKLSEADLARLDPAFWEMMGDLGYPPDMEAALAPTSPTA